RDASAYVNSGGSANRDACTYPDIPTDIYRADSTFTDTDRLTNSNVDSASNGRCHRGGYAADPSSGTDRYPDRTAGSHRHCNIPSQYRNCDADPDPSNGCTHRDRHWPREYATGPVLRRLIQSGAGWPLAA